MGAFLIILGIGWFVSYAFAENWIGPFGRIAAGLAVGAAVMAAGFWLDNKNTAQGSVILLLGAAAILITTYAAREVYDYFTPSIALVMMAATAAFIALTSVQRKLVTRAMAGLLIASVAPFLTVSASPSVTGLFLYLFVVIAASLWIVVVTGWKELVILATMIYAVISIGTLSTTIPASELVTMQVIVTAFVVLLYGMGVISALRTKSVIAADVLIKVVSAAVFLYWTHELVPQHMQSLIACAASLMSAMTAWMLLSSTKNKWLVLLHSSLALVYLAVAVAFELEGPAALYAYMALSVVGVWLAGMITKNLKTAQWFGLPLVYVAFETIRLLTTRVSNWQTFYGGGYDPDYARRVALLPVVEWSEVLLATVLTAVVVGLGWYLYTTSKTEDTEHVSAASEAVIGYFWAGVVLFVITIWAALERLPLDVDTAHGWALVIYAITGIVIYIAGKLENHGKKMLTGGLLLAGVVVRLLLVEVWNMEVTARVIVFILIGILLIAAAFVRPKILKETA